MRGATPAAAHAPGLAAAPAAAPAEPVAAAGTAFQPAHDYDWRLLSAPPQETYGDAANPLALSLFRFEPRFVLEIGCNTGNLGRLIKEKFPASLVWGVEPNTRTAAIARQRLDRVLSSPLEQVDWAREGVAAGTIDTVILFDVLEHIFDPWSTLLRLRDLVAHEAQLIVSIPNVRNVMLLQDLISGHWRYRKVGLLDITHIRFFTDRDLYRMFYQTGFRVMGRTVTFDERSQAVYAQAKGKAFPQSIELAGASIRVQSHDELVSFCALQNMFNLAPARYEQLTAEERNWIDAPYPETLAYAGPREA